VVVETLVAELVAAAFDAFASANLFARALIRLGCGAGLF